MEPNATVSRPTLVRTAGEFDADQIVSMGHAMHHESPRFEWTDYHIPKITAMVQAIIQEGGAFIAEKGEEAVGCMLGEVSEHFFGRTLEGMDWMVYVKPQYRGTRAAYLLIKAFESWAVHKGAKVITLGIFTQVNPERVLQFYGKMGYEPGAIFATKRII